MSRFHPANLRAAWWAVRTARRTRHLLDASGLDAALAPPAPPPLPVEAERGVRGALRHWRETCLVNAIVLQAWEAAHGRQRDLVIGVTGPDGFHAHAWLEGDPLLPADAALEDWALDVRGSWAGGLMQPNGRRARRSRGDVTVRPFSELLRRPAPDYSRVRSTRAL